MIELYQSEGCPHCGKVRDKHSDVRASYVIHNPPLPGKQGGDVTNEQTYTEMTELGGLDQIPYLVDTTRDEALYESDDIVDYLEEHYA
jgi:glutaredoxin 2